jgi:hypothetical protein
MLHATENLYFDNRPRVILRQFAQVYRRSKVFTLAGSGSSQLCSPTRKGSTLPSCDRSRENRRRNSAA